MREDIRDWIFLTGKTLLVIIGGILTMGGLVELVVAGPTPRGLGALAVGLALALPPLALAFRDALHHARRGRI